MTYPRSKAARRAGTPAGIGPIKAGDEVSVEIERVGFLLNPVVDEGLGESTAMQ